VTIQRSKSVLTKSEIFKKSVANAVMNCDTSPIVLHYRDIEKFLFNKLALEDSFEIEKIKIYFTKTSLQ
jgi:hypothetical protein